MKKITLENYRDDKFYPRIVRAVEALLARGDVVAPVDVFAEMQLLDRDALEDWRFGRVPYLEKVIRCNLSAASRILRILRMHAHDLNLRPSHTVYRRFGRGPKQVLRFTKSGDRGVETAYATHLVRVRSKGETQGVEGGAACSPTRHPGFPPFPHISQAQAGGLHAADTRRRRDVSAPLGEMSALQNEYASSMKPASRYDTIELSLIRQINQLLKPGTINLGIGEPNLEPDETLREMMERAARETSWSYSAIPGSPEVRRAIASFLDSGVDPEAEVCVTAGSEEALYALMQAWIDRGDEVLIPDPGFVAYPALTTLAGGTPVTYPLVAGDWSIDLDALRERITDRTKMMIVNSPSNPTGGVIPGDQLEEIAALAEERGFLLVSDEVYREIHFGERPPSLLGKGGNVVVVTSLSKSHGLTGLRLGWIVGSPDIMNLTRRAHHYITTCASTYAQKLAELVLGSAEWNRDWLTRARAQFTMQRDVAIAAIDEHVAPRAGVDPGGAFYAFVPVPTCDTLGLARRMATEGGVLAIPGVAFGAQGEGFLRISFASGPETLREGIGRIARALAEIEN